MMSCHVCHVLCYNVMCHVCHVCGVLCRGRCLGLKGLSCGALSAAVAEQALVRGGGRCAVREARGRAGDVLLMHPLLLHARSTNLGE
jgi:hypothetical protein